MMAFSGARNCVMMWICAFGLSVAGVAVADDAAKDKDKDKQAGEHSSEQKNADDGKAGEEAVVAESELGSTSVLGRAWQGGFIVFTVLLSLICMSIATWAVGIGKVYYLRKLENIGQQFVRNFWDSRSLNELNSKLNDYPYSPVREVFRSGYAELVRGSQLRETAQTHELILHVAVENLTRALGKAKLFEKRRLEKYLAILAISASSAPFIGLFGTVWGIMGAFEGIARMGNASLAAVAPGISEALIATAFGLAAAIPAVICYNLANARIRGQMAVIDGFSADFLNIVERYMVSDKSKSSGNSSPVENKSINVTST